MIFVFGILYGVDGWGVYLGDWVGVLGVSRSLSRRSFGRRAGGGLFLSIRGWSFFRC